MIIWPIVTSTLTNECRFKFIVFVKEKYVDRILVGSYCCNAWWSLYLRNLAGNVPLKVVTLSWICVMHHIILANVIYISMWSKSYNREFPILRFTFTKGNSISILESPVIFVSCIKFTNESLWIDKKYVNIVLLYGRVNLSWWYFLCYFANFLLVFPFCMITCKKVNHLMIFEKI